LFAHTRNDANDPKLPVEDVRASVAIGGKAAAATTAAQNVDSLHREILLQCGELTRNLNILLGTMQVGDANITTINAQIAALS
jgi:hypothetical protein